MEVIIKANMKHAAELVAQLVADQIHKKPKSSMGLATGNTMEAVYDELVKKYQNGALDFSAIHTFNLDEYIGLPEDSVHSYRSYMNRFLFDRVNISKENTHLPMGCAADLKAECQRYENLIKKYPIDVQLLGIGRTGHIGFNEPLSSLMSRTRDKSLTPQTIEQNIGLFGDQKDLMPQRALTMGVGTILEARQIILLATGSSKAEIIAKALEGPVTSMVTASALQLHPHCVVVLDEAAAANLQGTEYYRWIYENEPDWAPYR